jgi:hypothetical protein
VPALKPTRLKMVQQRPRPLIHQRLLMRLKSTHLHLLKCPPLIHQRLLMRLKSTHLHLPAPTADSLRIC